MASRYRNRSASTPLLPISQSALGVIDSLDQTNIFCGPGRDPADAVFSEDGVKSFSVLLEELSLLSGVSLRSELRALPQHIGSPIRDWTEEQVARGEAMLRFDDDYGFVLPLRDSKGVEFGLGALIGDRMDGYKVRGLLIGEHLAVDPFSRFAGIGTALVSASLLYREGLPGWTRENPRYNASGMACAIHGLEAAQRLSARLQREPDDALSM